MFSTAARKSAYSLATSRTSAFLTCTCTGKRDGSCTTHVSGVWSKPKSLHFIQFSVCFQINTLNCLMRFISGVSVPCPAELNAANQSIGL